MPARHTHSFLLDERGSPTFRSAFVDLARKSNRIDTALSRIRLAGLDLERAELRSVRHIRLVLGEVNARTLRSEAEALSTDATRARQLRFLVLRLLRGSIEVRASPLSGWTPDFSVFRGDEGAAALIGHHWFQHPYPFRGPAFGTIHSGLDAARVAIRFEGLWATAHDIGPALRSVLGPVFASAAHPLLAP